MKYSRHLNRCLLFFSIMLFSVVPLGEVAVDFGKESGMGQALCPQSCHSQMGRIADAGRAEIRDASLALFGVDFRD